MIDVSTINNKEENRVKRRDGRSKTMITRCALALLKAPKNVRRGGARHETKRPLMIQSGTTEKCPRNLNIALRYSIHLYLQYSSYALRTNRKHLETSKYSYARGGCANGQRAVEQCGTRHQFVHVFPARLSCRPEACHEMLERSNYLNSRK